MFHLAAWAVGSYSSNPPAEELPKSVSQPNQGPRADESPTILPNFVIATFSEVFINPETGKVYEEGESYKCLALADTLERIAHDPEDFYSGETARMLIDDLTDLGGQMNLGDLKNYTSVWQVYFVL